jgi:hypothetical protein
MGDLVLGTYQRLFASFSLANIEDMCLVLHESKTFLVFECLLAQLTAEEDAKQGKKGMNAHFPPPRLSKKVCNPRVIDLSPFVNPEDTDPDPNHAFETAH